MSTQALQLHMAKPAPLRKQARVPIAAEELQAPFASGIVAGTEDAVWDVVDIASEVTEVRNLVASVDVVAPAPEDVTDAVLAGRTERVEVAEGVAVVDVFVKFGTTDMGPLDVAGESELEGVAGAEDVLPTLTAAALSG